MNSDLVIPREVIDAYDFSILPISEGQLDAVKKVLTNHFNALFCEHYLKTKQPLPAVQVALGIPSAIKELHTKDGKLFSKSPLALNGKKEKRERKEKREPFWTDDATHVDHFLTFLRDEYIPSDHPETKFKDVLIAFVKRHPEVKTQLQWNSRYQPLCEKAQVKFARVPDPNYPKSEGTYHLHLRPKNPPATTPASLPSTVGTAEPLAPPPAPVMHTAAPTLIVAPTPVVTPAAQSFQIPPPPVQSLTIPNNQ